VDISVTRWLHDLRVRTSDGQQFPLAPGTMQGFWTQVNSAGGDFNNYWYFHTTGQFIQGRDWWIYDATTHETSPWLNQNDLSHWVAPGAQLDTDGDGLPDWFEALIGTSSVGPHPQDTDDDGLPDLWEVQHHLNPNSATGKDGPDGDFDGDGLTNREEYDLGSNPALADTDGDGIDDKDEITMHLDPLHPFVRPPPTELSLEINLVLE
jgi:hypothetical protein